MILIKDRHCHSIFCSSFLYLPGKYDTYKGSTQSKNYSTLFLGILGNMILIKDRHDKVSSNPISLNILGKYDTYKGSTLELNSSFSSSFRQGKYDTYKGSTRK